MSLRWARGMASFQRDNIVKTPTLSLSWRQMITERTVDCIPLEDVMQRLPSDRLDLLQVDAEGAEGYICLFSHLIA
jgi:hypothetical protein